MNSVVLGFFHANTHKTRKKEQNILEHLSTFLVAKLSQFVGT